MMDVNWIAIIACAVAAMVIGFLWFGPMLLGKAWQKEAGVSDSEAKKANNMQMYVFMFVAAAIEAYVLSIVLGLMGTVDYISAATGAFWLWLGFIAAVMIGSVLAEGRSWTYYAIVSGYQLVLIVVMSAILVSL